MLGLYDFERRLGLRLEPLVFYFRYIVEDPFFHPTTSQRRWHPLCSLVQGWVKSGQDSRRLSYLSALMAEGLGFVTVVAVPQLALAYLPSSKGRNPFGGLWLVVLSAARLSLVHLSTA